MYTANASILQAVAAASSGAKEAHGLLEVRGSLATKGINAPADLLVSLIARHFRTHGLPGVFDLGRSAAATGRTPHLLLVTDAPDVFALAQRWEGLEQLGNPPRRTSIAPVSHQAIDVVRASASAATVKRPDVEIAFCGLTVGLLEVAGYRDVEAELLTADGRPVPLWAGRRFSSEAGMSAHLGRGWRLRWSRRLAPLRFGFSPPPLAWPSLVRKLAATCADPASGELTLAAAALDAGMSERTLQRRLGEAGLNLEELRRIVLANHAASLLAAGAPSLTEVAFQAGYADASHMGREIKRLTGMTPARFRRLATAP